MGEFLLSISVSIFLIWCLRVYSNRHPLEPEEVIQLARARQRTQALSKYQFSQKELRVSLRQKKAMRAKGEFVRCDLNYKAAPAWVAAMLKYKKHE